MTSPALIVSAHTATTAMATSKQQQTMVVMTVHVTFTTTAMATMVDSGDEGDNESMTHPPPRQWHGDKSMTADEGGGR